MRNKSILNTAPSPSRARWLLGAAIALSTTCVSAVEIAGFTEPNRSVEVASPEQGIVTEVHVRVGEFVVKGQPIASLDDDLHRIMLDTARDRKSARGALEAAEAELQMRTSRLEKLQELVQEGFGRKEELERAQADHEIAQAELKAEREKLIEQQWQFTKIEAELRRRVVVAPMDGIVAARLKEQGEYVAPNEPNVITLVELNPLLAKFPMKRSQAKSLRINGTVDVRLEDGKVVQGIVDEISPIVDAQSGTIKVKVRIDNHEGALLSGERCTINVPTPNDETPVDGEVPVKEQAPGRKVALQR
jgi:RND family efflux transporter MFP subunit